MAKLYKHKKLTSILSCLLIVVLVFNICTIPAKAEVITLTVGAVAGFIALLGLLGVSFASIDYAQKATESFANKHYDIWNEINNLIPDGGNGGGGLDFAITAGSISALKNIFDSIKSFFSNSVEYTENNGWVNDSENVFSLDSVGYVSPDVFIDYVPDVFNQILSVYGVDLSSQKFIFCGSRYVESTNKYIYSVLVSSASSISVSESGVYLSTWYKTEGYMTGANGKLNYTVSTVSSLVPSDFTLGYYFNVGHFDYVTVDIPYEFETDYSSDDIYSGISSSVNNLGSVSIPTSNIITAIETENNDLIRQDQDLLIDSIIGLRDALNNPSSPENPSDDSSPWDSVGTDDFNMPSLKLVFPFCVPFDLIDLVQTLNARAEAPVFTIPVNFDFVDYHDEIVVDLSEWESVAVVMRWGSTISFMLALILISRKMIRG